MNWGVKITLVILAFITTMISMVVFAFHQTNEMTDKNYYQKEMKYQQIINASANLNQVTTDDIIVQDSGVYYISIPKSLIQGFKEGQCEILRWNNQSQDVHISFTPDQNGNYALNSSMFVTGRYTARISWESRGTPYYKEQSLFIQK